MQDLKHEPSHFGGCPECGQDDGYMNVRQDHWCVCDEHKTKWWAGSNLFSCWREESEGIWKNNVKKLADYINVESRHYKTAFEELRKAQIGGAA